MDITNKLCFITPRTVLRRGVRMPRLFHTDMCKTNALRQLVETYNTHLLDIDIFSLSHQKFKVMAIELLDNMA